MQAKFGSHGDYPSVALVPNSVMECFTLTVKAFNISEKFRIPVLVLSDAIVGHMYEKVVLPGEGVEVIDRLRPEAYGLPQDEDLLFERLVKEALHELGHTMGLIQRHWRPRWKAPVSRSRTSGPCIRSGANRKAKRFFEIIPSFF